MTVEPLRLQLHLTCAPQHAFDVWTRRTTLWWPPSHTVSGAPTDVVIEGRVGGRVFERSADGTEHDWGEVTGWEPPHRLAYLWHLRRDRKDATDVLITFTPARGGTDVRIEHSGWERLGADADTWRDRNRAGWGGVLPHFTRAAEGSGEGPAGERPALPHR